MVKLSLIIVSWNTARFLRNCLRSVYDNPPPFLFEVIVVDNASSDESVSIVAREFPEVKLHQNHHNLGFAKAANQGWRQSSGFYVLFLNPDTLILPRSLERAVCLLEKEKDVGILGGLTLNENQKAQASAYAIPSSLRFFAFIIGANKILSLSKLEKLNRPRYAGYIQGSFLLTRRPLLEELGGFDENFFMYGEDADFCLRAWRKGWKTLFDPSVTIIHYGSKSPRSRPSINQDFVNSLLYFSQKNLSTQEQAKMRIAAISGLLFLAVTKLSLGLFFRPGLIEESRQHLKILSSVKANFLQKRLKKPYFYFAGVRINNLTRQEAVKEIAALLPQPGPSLVFTPNAYHFVLLKKDKIFHQAYMSARLVLADGMSLVFASYLLGSPLKQRVAGADLFPEICRLAASLNRRVFFLGGEAGSEKQALLKINRLWPGLKAMAYSPPFGFESDPRETEKIRKMIHEFRTDLLFCFVGSPKSEKWLYQNLPYLKVTIAASLGASLKYFVGVEKRAPSILRSLGLEWSWRLVHDPSRLWKRYLVGNLEFIGLVFRELLSGQKKQQ